MVVGPPPPSQTAWASKPFLLKIPVSYATQTGRPGAPIEVFPTISFCASASVKMPNTIQTIDAIVRARRDLLIRHPRNSPQRPCFFRLSSATQVRALMELLLRSLPQALKKPRFVQFVDVAILVIRRERCLLRGGRIDELQSDELLGQILENFRRDMRIFGESFDTRPVALIE